MWNRIAWSLLKNTMFGAKPTLHSKQRASFQQWSMVVEILRSGIAFLLLGDLLFKERWILSPINKFWVLKLEWKLVQQQGNDPNHTSKTPKDLFKRNRIRTLNWPGQRPDSNPIEMLWLTKEQAELYHEVKSLLNYSVEINNTVTTI